MARTTLPGAGLAAADDRCASGSSTCGARRRRRSAGGTGSCSAVSPDPLAPHSGHGSGAAVAWEKIATLTATEAVLHAEIGARQTYRRKPRAPLHPAERCLVWELDTVTHTLSSQLTDISMNGPEPLLEHAAGIWSTVVGGDRRARGPGRAGRRTPVLTPSTKISPAQVALCLIDP